MDRYVSSHLHRVIFRPEFCRSHQKNLISDLNQKLFCPNMSRVLEPPYHNNDIVYLNVMCDHLMNVFYRQNQEKKTFQTPHG